MTCYGKLATVKRNKDKLTRTQALYYLGDWGEETPSSREQRSRFTEWRSAITMLICDKCKNTKPHSIVLCVGKVQTSTRAHTHTRILVSLVH